MNRRIKKKRKKYIQGSYKNYKKLLKFYIKAASTPLKKLIV